MIKRFIRLAVILLFISFPLVLQAQTPPHDSSNNVNCLDCHEIHNASAGNLVARGAEQETLCKT